MEEQGVGGARLAPATSVLRDRGGRAGLLGPLAAPLFCPV